MKYLASPSNKKMVNLETIETIMVSCSYLVLVTLGGQAGREIQFVHATSAELTALFCAIQDFLMNDLQRVFDVDDFLAEFRERGK